MEVTPFSPVQDEKPGLWLPIFAPLSSQNRRVRQCTKEAILMLYQMSYSTEFSDGFVEGEFASPRQANVIAGLFYRLSNLCRTYENSYYQLLPTNIQRLIEHESIQMRVIVLGDVITARFYSEQAAVRSVLNLNKFLLRLLLRQLARKLGHETASSFRVLVLDDETKFRTVEMAKFIADQQCN